MRRLLIAGMLACHVPAMAVANTLTLGWFDLIDPSAQTYEDPYRDLTYRQVDDLRTVVRLRARLSDDDVADEARPKIEARLATAEAELSAGGIDVDWLLDQRWVVADRRKNAATAGNPEVDGETVSLAGFAIAGPPDADGTPIVYLVPERGMCSHTPPPDPNQMLRVRISGDWQPRMMHEPVRLTGQISITPSEQTMQVVDGMVPMRATFLMQADKIETLPDPRAQGRAATQ